MPTPGNVIPTIEGKVYWTPETNPPSPEYELNVKEIKINIDPSLQSAAGSKSAPYDCSVATLFKVEGSFTVYFDTVNNHFDAAISLRPGQRGWLRCPIERGTNPRQWRLYVQIGKCEETPFSTEEVKVNSIDYMGNGRIWYPGEAYP